MGWGLGGGRGHERGPGDPLASDVSRIDPWTATPHCDIDEMFASRCRQGPGSWALQRVSDGTGRSATVTHTNG